MEELSMKDSQQTIPQSEPKMFMSGEEKADYLESVRISPEEKKRLLKLKQQQVKQQTTIRK